MAWIYVGAKKKSKTCSTRAFRKQHAWWLARLRQWRRGSNGPQSIPRHAEHGSYERQLSCQIWSLDGRLVARSSGAPDENLSAGSRRFFDARLRGRPGASIPRKMPPRASRLVGDRLGLRAHLVGESSRVCWRHFAHHSAAWPADLGKPRPRPAPLAGVGARACNRATPTTCARSRPRTIPGNPARGGLNHLFRKVRRHATRTGTDGVCGARAAHAAGGTGRRRKSR